MKDIEKMTIQDSFLLLKSKIEKLSEKRIIALNKEIEKLNHKNNFLKKQIANQKENIKALRYKYQKEIKNYTINNEKTNIYLKDKNNKEG